MSDNYLKAFRFREIMPLRRLLGRFQGFTRLPCLSRSSVMRKLENREAINHPCCL